MLLCNLYESNKDPNYGKKYAVLYPLIRDLMDSGYTFRDAEQLIRKKLASNNVDEIIHTIKNKLSSDGYDVNLEEGMAWGRVGKSVVKKYRCSGGTRHGRIVSKPAQCFAPPDIKKRIKLKQTKAKYGSRMARKRKRTMKTNPASKRVQTLNKSRKS